MDQPTVGERGCRWESVVMVSREEQIRRGRNLGDEAAIWATRSQSGRRGRNLGDEVTIWATRSRSG